MQGRSRVVEANQALVFFSVAVDRVAHDDVHRRDGGLLFRVFGGRDAIHLSLFLSTTSSSSASFWIIDYRTSSPTSADDCA